MEQPLLAPPMYVEEDVYTQPEMVLRSVNQRFKPALTPRAAPAPPAPAAPRCPWVLPRSILTSAQVTWTGDYGKSASASFAVRKAGSSKGGRTWKKRKEKKKKKSQCPSTSKNSLGDAEKHVVPNASKKLRTRPSRLKIQKSISNLWLVFTFCKRNPAEQIPPETADLRRLQGHVKKLLHAEF